MNQGFCRWFTSAVSSASVGWLQFELMCDGPRNTALMMPSSISHCCLEGAEEEMRNIKYTVKMASLDVEMKWKWVVWAKRGELVVWLVKFAWIRACIKPGLLDDPDYPDQQKCRPMEIAHCRSWKIALQCVFSTSSVSCWTTLWDIWMGVSLAERTCWPLSLIDSTNTGTIITGK